MIEPVGVHFDKGNPRPHAGFENSCSGKNQRETHHGTSQRHNSARGKRQQLA